jgi:catechol 2,3-dioxygenase-like lactoylglutathione lyase family enzyme
MFQGLRTVIYHVDNLEKAKAWYTEVLGIKPYFDQPFYVGFNVGGYELELTRICRECRKAITPSPIGA